MNTVGSLIGDILGTAKCRSMTCFERILKVAATYKSDIKWRDCQSMPNEEIGE